jgi:rieske iron-sulfur protein
VLSANLSQRHCFALDRKKRKANDPKSKFVRRLLFGRVEALNFTMSGSKFTPPVEPIAAQCECTQTTRRSILLTALATGACLAGGAPAVAEEEARGSSDRPQKADLFVFAEGEHAGEVIKPDDLKAGGPPVRAWPKDPASAVIRKGSRLNEVVLVKLDPAELDDDTRAHAADGIVAYSVVCTHAGCPITAWVKQASGDDNVLKCMCHNSEFDPRRSAQVVFGPAPRRLAALPLALSDGALSVAASFVGKVGTQPG